jgi:hypothetical protein
VRRREEEKPKKTMNECGSSVTLIFYSLDKEWWKREPVLNILAAAAQMSTFTHVEVALGEEAGTSGEMSNVLRVFNDACGVVHPTFKTRTHAPFYGKRKIFFEDNCACFCLFCRN